MTQPPYKICNCTCKRTITGAVIAKRFHEMADGTVKEVVYAPNKGTIIWIRSPNGKATLAIGRDAFGKFTGEYYAKSDHHKRQLELLCIEPGVDCQVFQGALRLTAHGNTLYSAIVSHSGAELLADHDFVVLYDENKSTLSIHTNLRLVSKIHQIYPAAGRPVAPQTINFPEQVDPHAWIKACTDDPGPKCILLRAIPR